MNVATEKGSDAGTLTRSEVEDFLYAEAELLDEWRLPEWLDLFTDDAYQGKTLNIVDNIGNDANVLEVLELSMSSPGRRPNSLSDPISTCC